MRCNANVDKPTKRRERRLLKLSHFPSHGAISPEAPPLSGRGKVAPRGRAGRGAAGGRRRPFSSSCDLDRSRRGVFGEGRCVPLDRNAKARIKVFARALSHRTEKGKHYGVITAKFLAVLDALL